MKKFTPCLWLHGGAEKAAAFYVSVFKKRSKIKQTVRYSEATAKASGQPVGSVLTVSLEINGLDFLLLNGGPMLTMTAATSFIVHCKTQKEIDYYWKRLATGGKLDRCGWLTDQYGVSWQIVPENLNKLLSAKDPQKPARVMAAIMTMTKLDLKKLEKAYAGK